MDDDVRENLEIQLDRGLKKIGQLYAVYVTRIREALEAKKKKPGDLSTDLLNVPAFNHDKQARMLLSTHKTQLMAAKTLNDIFKLLSIEYASFLNYEIFQHIVDTNNLDNGDEVFKYPQKLNEYITKHKVSEFIKINPLSKKVTEASDELVLKFDIDSTSRVAKVDSLKKAIARIFDLNSLTLRLLDIKDGCVEVTFLIPTPVAKFVFNEKRVLTEEQAKQFQALPISWMKCNGRTFDFTIKEKIPEQM